MYLINEFYLPGYLTMSIDWPCYCTVYVYVVIHFCGSKSVQVFYRLFFVFQLEIKLLRGDVWSHINRFNPVIYLCLSQCRTWISNVIYRGLCYVQWVEVRGDCSFCWYWWTCWQSLSTLYFHLWSANTDSLNIAEHIVFTHYRAKIYKS